MDVRSLSQRHALRAALAAYQTATRLIEEGVPLDAGKIRLCLESLRRAHATFEAELVAMEARRLRVEEGGTRGEGG